MYRTIVADPPWSFNDHLPGRSRGASHNYPCMTTEAISRFLNLYEYRIAYDCRLFLWRVASMQEEALAVMRSWGFQLKSEIVWLKQTKNGQRWFGMGRTVRNEHETCLIGVRGQPAVLNHSTRSTFTAKVGSHSQKPEEFFDIVEGLSPGPYLELFARRQRPGWDCHGLGLE